MIRIFLFLLVALILSFCAIPGRIIEINDRSKEIQGIKLTQNLNAHTADEAIQTSIQQAYSVSMVHLLEQKKNERPTLFLEVQIETQPSSAKLDSVMILKLNNEELRIEANEFREFPKNNSGKNQIVSSRFLVPENLWVPIVYSDEIQYRFFIGNEGIVVKLTRKETSKLNEYFNRAIQLRDANLPPIPEGQKKW